MKKTTVVFCMYQIITGGIEKCLIRILDKLSKSDKYNFIVISKKNVTEEYFLDFFKKNNIKLVVLPEIEMQIGEKPKNLLKKILWNIKRKNVKKQNKKILENTLNNADVIFDYFNGSFSKELDNIHKPKVCFFHMSINFYKKAWDNNEDKLFNIYDKVICLTDSFYNDLITISPSNKHKCQRIYNPLDIQEIQNKANNTEVSDNGKYFVFLGRFHQDKDHNCVINAFAKFVKKYPDGKIYFIGTGELEQIYKDKVKLLGLENNILFTGVLNNPYGYVKNAVANILSSPNEGLSTVLIEAAAIGTLNISSDCPSSASEVLLNGKAGILFPIGDSDALAKILEDVWQNKVDKNALVNNALNAINRFDSNVVIPQIEKLIKEIAGLNNE